MTVDLIAATRGAVFRALNERATGAWQIFDDVPQGTQPDFLKIGTIDSENADAKGDDLERITVEIIAVYRGADRGVLLAMMHAARGALHRQPLIADGAVLQDCRWLTSSASDASPQDGVTYAGIGNFQLMAEPA